MKAIEYLPTTTPFPLRNDEDTRKRFEDWLDTLGRKGWRLLLIEPQTHFYIFMREQE